MSDSSSQRLRKDRGAEASVSGRQRARLLQRGALGAITVAQVDNLDPPGEVEMKEGAFSSFSSRIYLGDVKVMADSFRFPCGNQMLVPTVTDKAAYPLPGFMPTPPDLGAELAPMQLIPNLYGRFLTLYLSFRRNGIPSPSDNVIRYCFTLKQCPLAKGSPDDAFHDGMHYLSVRVGEYNELLQGDSNLNARTYKANYFFVKGPKIELLQNKSFVLLPSESALRIFGEPCLLLCQYHMLTPSFFFCRGYGLEP
ncbi:hypothetical protein ACOSP7_026825 [Xanthoceras sorbifolium]